jgi:hypothetical protein
MKEINTLEEALEEIQRLKDWNLRYFQLVEKLRGKQKEYLDSRAQRVLDECRMLEKQLDDLNVRMRKALDKRTAQEAENNPVFQAAKRLLVDKFDCVEVTSDS